MALTKALHGLGTSGFRHLMIYYEAFGLDHGSGRNHIDALDSEHHDPTRMLGPFTCNCLSNGFITIFIIALLHVFTNDFPCGDRYSVKSQSFSTGSVDAVFKRLSPGVRIYTLCVSLYQSTLRTQQHPPMLSRRNANIRQCCAASDGCFAYACRLLDINQSPWALLLTRGSAR